MAGHRSDRVRRRPRRRLPPAVTDDEVPHGSGRGRSAIAPEGPVEEGHEGIPERGGRGRLAQLHPPVAGSPRHVGPGTAPRLGAEPIDQRRRARGEVIEPAHDCERRDVDGVEVRPPSRPVGVIARMLQPLLEPRRRIGAKRAGDRDRGRVERDRASAAVLAGKLGRPEAHERPAQQPTFVRPALVRVRAAHHRGDGPQAGRSGGGGVQLGQPLVREAVRRHPSVGEGQPGCPFDARSAVGRLVDERCERPGRIAAAPAVLDDHGVAPPGEPRRVGEDGR